MSLLVTTLLLANAQANPDFDAGVLAVEAVEGPSIGLQLSHTELEPRKVLPWAAGTRVRLAQRLNGVPVLGSEIVVSLSPDGDVTHTRGEPVRDTGVSPEPDVMPFTAEQLGVDAAKLRSGASKLAWEPRSTVHYWVDVRGELHLVYKVDVGLGAPMTTWSVLVDAHDASVLAAKKSSFEAKGHVFETNPVNGDLMEVDLPGIDGDELDGLHTWVVSCTDWNADRNRCDEKASLAVPDGDGNFYFEDNAISADDPLAEVQMYYHLDKVSQYFVDTHGADLPKIEGIVNFDYDNAFFGDADGDGVEEVAFGQGRIDFAYDADVIYHEYGHAVFGSVVSGGGFFDADEYGITFASASINEGTADAFSIAITEDPLLGEYAGSGFSTDGSPVRDLDQDLRCPDDLYGESHEDGEVWAALAWRMIADERVGAALTSDVYWGALTSWPSEVTWEIAGESLIEVADDMKEAGVIDATQHEALIELTVDTGLDSCGRVVALDNGAAPKQALFHPGFLGDDLNVPAQNQFSLDTPEGTYRLWIEVSEWESQVQGLRWNLYVRRGEPVGHDLEEAFGGFSRPIPADYDFVIEGFDEEGFFFDLPAEDGLPSPEYMLEPGETYYFSVATRADTPIGGFAFAEITVQGEVFVLEEQPGACACSGTGAGGGALWLMPVGLLALRRRRA